MIDLHDDCEFSFTVTEIILTMADLSKNDNCFKGCIYVNTNELPFEFDNSYDFFFLQEGVKIYNQKSGKYIFLFYDVITCWEVELC